MDQQPGKQALLIQHALVRRHAGQTGRRATSRVWINGWMGRRTSRNTQKQGQTSKQAGGEANKKPARELTSKNTPPSPLGGVEVRCYTATPPYTPSRTTRTTSRTTRKTSRTTRTTSRTTKNYQKSQKTKYENFYVYSNHIFAGQNEHHGTS